MAATFKHFCVLVMAISVGIISSNETLAQQLPPSNGGGAPDTIIAQGHSNVLTHSAAEAYVSALEFILIEVGIPTNFDAETRQSFVAGLAQSYAYLPLQLQSELSFMQQIWATYLENWSSLELPQKQSFAYAVLSLAYGDAAAAQAVGYPQGGAGGDLSVSGGSLDDMMGSDVCYSGTCETMGDTTIIYDEN